MSNSSLEKKGGVMPTHAQDRDVELHRRLYSPSSKEPSIVDVPPMTFLMVNGVGDPNTSQQYKDAIEALYALSYTLKFAIKHADKVDYQVSMLEGLWWSDELDAFLAGARDAWRWTMMVRQPAAVTPERLEEARAEAARKKNLAALPGVRLEPFHEGLAAQIMHIGPYTAEAPTIQKLHDFIHAQGGDFDGRVQKHHELYLGDPRRAAPEKLKTVIRQPFTK
jgi:hypothetical protein